VNHDAYGWWIEDAWGVKPAGSTADLLRDQAVSAIEVDTEAEVVIVGGGFTGMWAALHLLESVPAERIVVLDSGVCGTGPSGRNGGFCDSFVEAAPRLLDQFGQERARDLVAKSISNIGRIGALEAEVGEFGFRQAGQLIAVAGQEQHLEERKLLGTLEALGLPIETARAVTGDQARELCGSPHFERGLYLRDTATVHPGQLARNLRQILLRRGVKVYESSPVARVRSVPSGVEVAMRNGARVQARRGILAAGVAGAGLGGMRREVTMTSSHIVLTEPVPDLLSRIGWKQGLAVTDARYLVHYFRTTEDQRVLFGWGGGGIASGVEPRRVQSHDGKVVSQTIADLQRMFPLLKNVPIDRAWGGPIDASPVHMPALRPFAKGWVAAFGYTGNGVGPSRLLGEAMADISTDSFGPNHPLSPLLVEKPVLLPPDPFSAIGGSVIRLGLDRVERRGEAGGRVPLWARAAAGLPDRLGYRIGR